MFRILSLCFFLPFAAASAQTADIEKLANELTREIREAQRGPQATVLILGSFHFANPGLDDFKPEHELDVFATAQQRELEEIAKLLAAFRPTRVAVERKPDRTNELQEQYEAYRAGNWKLPANELYQIGFRVAAATGHPRVYPIDAPGRSFQPYVDIAEFAKEHDLRQLQRQPYQSLYTKMWKRMDEMKMEHPLRQHLLLLNDPEMLRVQHGVYLQRSIAVSADGEYPGADGFVSQWYNRNLRIFANLQRLLEDDEERVLMIFGAGHVPILRHLVQSAPGMTLVEPSDYL